MIVTKGMSEISGYIEYSYDYETTMFNRDITEEDRDCMFESDTFKTLSEMLEKMQPEVLEKIKDSYEADKVWISCISFKGHSGDGETTSSLSLFENENGGHVATTISNEDITERAMLNMKKIKEIVDNTIDQYPVKY